MQEIYKNIKVYNLDHYGRGIAKIDNKVTFINNALPDEIVNVKIIKNNKKILEAEVLKHHNFSNKRVNSLCPYFLECGGCDLMHIDYNNQLQFKEKKVNEIISKFAQIDKSLIKLIIKTNQFNYRNKITLQVKENIGFYKKKSYDIVPINNCLLCDNKMNNIFNNLKDIELKNINQITIRASLNTNDVIVILDTNGPINEKEIIKSLSDINIIKKDTSNNKDNKYITLQGKSYVIENLSDYKFYISPESFFQINTIGALKLYNQILKYADLTGKEKMF